MLRDFRITWLMVSEQIMYQRIQAGTIQNATPERVTAPRKGITMPLAMVVGAPTTIASGIVMPFLGAVTLSGVAFWIVPAWILWYMICSLTISQVIRKSLNIGGL